MMTAIDIDSLKVKSAPNFLALGNPSSLIYLFLAMKVTKNM